MIKYTSTRDSSVSADGATAVLNGFAPDGGLYVPRELPALSFADMLDSDYAARVTKTLRAFFDFDVSGIAERAFKGADDPAPTVKIDDNAFVLELWHGKSLSHGDMALSVLPELIGRAKAEKNISATTLVVASGDMGKSAALAFGGTEGMRTCIFYPQNGLDELALHELRAVDRAGVDVTGVSADCDGLQSVVKSAFTDGSLNAALDDNNIALASADSVNMGVIVPQIAYYFSAYCDLVNSGEIKAGDKIDFVTSVGSFGGMIAGYYAVKMGLPIHRFVFAATELTAFTDFIDSGAYDINGVSGGPTAPALGNIERLIFDISGKDATLTAMRMNALALNGRFSVTEGEINALHDVFAGSYVNKDDVPDVIADLFEEYGYVADTRTAAACATAFDREFVRPTVVLSMANPYRSAKSVLTALGEKVPPDGERIFARLEELTAMEAPNDLLTAFSSKQDTDVIPPQEVPNFLLKRYCGK